MSRVISFGEGNKPGLKPIAEPLEIQHFNHHAPVYSTCTGQIYNHNTLYIPTSSSVVLSLFRSSNNETETSENKNDITLLQENCGLKPPVLHLICRKYNHVDLPNSSEIGQE